ncbi:hypothetical protein V6N12_030716 [Hibiscus sabdariffa]|uniref:Uncharacterized protein n=1 Tax=Hibiscus sabdariffa TaxID=183260 RepID=A0ABR2E6V1_9ROSI
MSMLEPLGDVMGDRRRSNTGWLYGEFAFVWLLIPWVALSIKIYRCAITRTEKEEMLQYSRKDEEQCDAAALVH